MADKDSELKVVHQNSDGRRRYDEKGKRGLVEAALRPGVSMARLAQEHRINANLLRKWISKNLMEREKDLVPASQDNDANGCDLPPAGEVIDGLRLAQFPSRYFSLLIGRKIAHLFPSEFWGAKQAFQTCPPIQSSVANNKLRPSDKSGCAIMESRTAR
ncbi:transposase [Burkholderia orbicola]|uniref:transposase n=1 Tax=Burkholderia orbicola TaxID=2978683 RepID=UPI0039A5FC63